MDRPLMLLANTACTASVTEPRIPLDSAALPVHQACGHAPFDGNCALKGQGTSEETCGRAIRGRQLSGRLLLMLGRRLMHLDAGGAEFGCWSISSANSKVSAVRISRQVHFLFYFQNLEDRSVVVVVVKFYKQLPGPAAAELFLKSAIIAAKKATRTRTAGRESKKKGRMLRGWKDPFEPRWERPRQRRREDEREVHRRALSFCSLLDSAHQAQFTRRAFEMFRI